MLIDLPQLNTSTLVSHRSNFEDLKLFLSQRKPYSSAVIISDANVYPFFGASIVEQLKDLNIPAIKSIVVDAGENSKSLYTAHYCWEKMYQTGVDRQSLVIGLGGGVITDLAGYVAACYMRGIDVIHVPTSLTGMVDAAIGGKTGVNLAKGKNIIGAIYQPKFVLIVPECLSSLPERDFLSGLAEIVKYGIISDPELFKVLEENEDSILSRNSELIGNIIRRCCKIKLDIIEKDERDQGLRAILNLGHTFAHALETATNYGIYLHGEAVSIGMSCAFHMSHFLGWIDDSPLIRLHDLLKKLKLPTNLPDMPPLEVLIEKMYGDKKTVNGKLNLILVRQIGHVEKISNVDPQLILKALNKKKDLE